MVERGESKQPIGNGRVRTPLLALMCATSVLLTGGCAQTDARAGTGDARRGGIAITRNACGSCHVIPGLEESRGMVGPSLAHFAQRQTIAGVLPNTPEALRRYLLDPKSVNPANVMPNQGLTDRQAADIAAYLYTLR